MNDLSPGRSGPAHVITIEVGDPDLNFRPISIPHAVPTGRQILEATGAHPIDDHVALALLPNGDTEALRLDEHLDLRGRGVGRVILFKTDRLFRLEVDRRKGVGPGHDQRTGAQISRRR